MRKLLIISILAVLFRLYILIEFAPDCCGSDENVYHSIANNLVYKNSFVLTRSDERRLWNDQVFGAKPPAYPFFIAGIYKLVGVNFQVVRMVQIMLSVFTGILIYLIAKKTFSQKVGMTSLLIYSFFWETSFMSLNLFSENLYWFFMSLAIYLLISDRLLGVKKVVLVGILLGLTALTRASALSLIIPISVWFVWKNLKLKSFLLLSIIVVMFLLTMAPWAWRNYRIYGKLVPIYTGGGMNFWMGNYPDSGGSYNVPNEEDPTQTPTLTQKGAAQEIEWDNFYYRQALNYVWSSPLAALDTDLRKVFITFSVHRPVILNTTSSYGNWWLGRPHSTGINAILEFLVSYQFAFLTAVFFLQLILSLINFRQTNHSAWLLISLFFWHILTIAASHAEPRYVSALFPLMIPFAAAVCLPLWNVIILKNFKNK